MEFGSQNFTQNKGTETDKTKRRKTDKETPLMRFPWPHEPASVGKHLEYYTAPPPYLFLGKTAW